MILCPDAETLGVNSRSDLAAAEAIFQTAARAAATPPSSATPDSSEDSQ